MNDAVAKCINCGSNWVSVFYDYFEEAKSGKWLRISPL